MAKAFPTYLATDLRLPYCKGCGHAQVMRALNNALVKLQLDPADIEITTDIGCVGLADALFPEVHTVHTTHGRSTAVAVGTAVADRVLADGKLKTLVLIGDGGAMIGLLHLVHAAQMNADVTVLLHNNLLFGMTGGQNSAFSPLGFVTATTPRGNVLPPIDICQIIQGCGAGFVGRKFATDRDLPDTIVEAIGYPGFALVEVMELCPAHRTRQNGLSGKRLKELAENQGYRMGVLSCRRDRKEFSLVYREKFPRAEACPAEDFVSVSYRHCLTRQIGLIISGTAGERVQSSARLLCQAALMSGLHATQKNDNLVTQGTGFSLSEVCLSPEPILYTGIDSADCVIAVSDDGLQELKGTRAFENLKRDGLAIVDSDLEPVSTCARVISLPVRRLVSGEKAAAAAIGFYLKASGIIPLEAYQAAWKEFFGDKAEIFVEALENMQRKVEVPYAVQ